MEQFNKDKVAIDFARVNAEKTSYIVVVTIFLTQINELLNLGVSNEHITLWGGVISAMLILAGTIRQIKK